MIDTNGHETQLADFVAGNLSWSPDGNQIATWSVDSRHGDHPSPLAIVDSSGGGTTVFRLANGYTSIDQYPLWSPDGQWIAFNGYVGSTLPDESEPTRIIVLHPTQERAFVLAEGIIAKGWMAGKP
jgi:Tol biopolymer transport system component